MPTHGSKGKQQRKERTCSTERRCMSNTKKNIMCKRCGKTPGTRCWQHMGKSAAVKISKSQSRSGSKKASSKSKFKSKSKSKSKSRKATTTPKKAARNKSVPTSKKNTSKPKSKSTIKSREGNWSKRIFDIIPYAGVADGHKAYKLSRGAMNRLELYEKNPELGLSLNDLLYNIGDYNISGVSNRIELKDVNDVIEVELSLRYSN